MSYLRKLLFALLYRLDNNEAYKKYQIDRWNALLAKQMKAIGNNFVIPMGSLLKNPHYVSIGNGFTSMCNLRIEAWDSYRNQKFSPEIIIGNNVIFNTDIHIGCINKIVIGNDVLLASRIYISDHSHGEINKEELDIPPTERKLSSKGPVIIEDNVWIGEGVCVLAGVTIGKGSIIGANAVVTKSIPPNSVAAGIPARVIRQLGIDA